MLFSSSISLDAFVKPASIDGSLEVKSMVSISDSEYYDWGTGVVTTAAYDKFILILSGREGE
jgi:hypothetical protein